MTSDTRADEGQNRNSACPGRRTLDRSRLPEPTHYYEGELKTFVARNGWGRASCPFHHDRHPSFGFHLASGGFHCFACGARGGDVIAFRMRRYGQGFVEAVTALGAWRSE